MSAQATYKIAHTARCKLHMAAENPDRNLRFILGHAFTLDNVRLRIAEIELSDSSDSDEDLPELAHNPTCTGVSAGTGVGGRAAVGGGAGTGGARRVSFQGPPSSKVQSTSGVSRSRRSPPPPPQLDEDTDSDDEEDEYADEEAEKDDGLGLVRFGSAAAQPPKILQEEEDIDNGDEPENGEDEGKKFEFGNMKYSEEEVRRLCMGEGNKELVEAYRRVVGCPCHGEKGPSGKKFWELPMKEGEIGTRIAVMEVA